MTLSFMFITGIEDTFVARTDRNSQRSLDEYELTQHYYNWKEDLKMIANVGFKYIRYGIPWYLINKSPGKFDWSWTDQVFEHMEKIGLTPIVDFIHYGTPLWLDNAFINSGFPDYMAEYELRTIERYKDFLKYYTPMNEPFITQQYCGYLGIWPPYLKGSNGFAMILKNTAKGIVKSVSAIKREFPDVFALHVEASGMFFTKDPQLKEFTEQQNELRFLTYDLITGKVNESHKLYNLLLDNGFSHEEIEWFILNRIEIDGYGVNYYPQFSVYEVKKEGNSIKYHPFYGGNDYLRKLLLTYSEKYGGPIFLTETSINGGVEMQKKWWYESTKLMKELVNKGLDIKGYTWFPAIDLINWDYRYGNEPVEKYIESMGFIKLGMNASKKMVRKPTELAENMKKTLAKWSLHHGNGSN